MKTLCDGMRVSRYRLFILQLLKNAILQVLLTPKDCVLAFNTSIQDPGLPTTTTADTSCNITDSEQCPDGWTQPTSNPPVCAYFSRELKTFEESRAYCQSFGGDLAVPFSDEMREYIKEVFTDVFYGDVWLAYNSRNPHTDKWTWNYGDIRFQKDTRYPEIANNARIPAEHTCSVLSVSGNNLRPVPCTETHHVMCHHKQGNCADGWVSLLEGECFKIYDETMTFEEAIERCRPTDTHTTTHILHLYDKLVSDAVKDFLRRSNVAWTGLTRSSGQQDGWSWISGTKASSNDMESWVKGHPDDTQMHCSVIQSGSDEYLTYDCESKVRFMCMSGRQGGPRKPELTVEYHRSDGIFYLNQTSQYSCTVLGSDDVKFTVSIGNSHFIIDTESEFVEIKKDITYVEPGVCTINTTKTVYWDAMRPLNNTELTCHTGNIDKYWKTCRALSPAVSFCTATDMIILDGPRGGPDLTINYTGYPGPINVDDVAELSCMVETGPHGSLVWTLSVNDETEILDENSPLVSYSFNISSDKHLLTSEIKLKVDANMSGAVISCFSYDVVQYGDGSMACLSDDKYCSSFEPLKVREKEATSKDKGDNDDDKDDDNEDDDDEEEEKREFDMLNDGAISLVYILPFVIILWVLCHQVIKFFTQDDESLSDPEDKIDLGEPEVMGNTEAAAGAPATVEVVEDPQIMSVETQTKASTRTSASTAIF